MMDEERCETLDVPTLFEDWNKLPWEKFTALCSNISSRSALEICDAVATYYNGLPNKQRFHICAGPRDWQHARITGWTDWRENGRTQYAEYFMPSRKTILAQSILYKAGVSYWLTWLDCFSDHTQVVALLLDAQRSGWDLLQAFALSCGTKDTYSIRTILFCLFISEKQSESEQTAFLSTVYKHDKLFLSLCLEVLSDFHFQMAYPEKGTVYDSIAAMCANDGALACLGASSAMTIGVLSAWAKLLSLLDPTQEQLDQFKSAYFNWVSETNGYMLLNDITGQYYKREIDFLDFLISVFALDDRAVDKLKLLWKKKTCVYYRWNSSKEYSQQQWFQHIGLILWCIGAEEYNRNGSIDLVIYVLKRMNDAIPMMLTKHDYQLLLCKVFCSSMEDVPVINELLCNLIHKIYEPSLLYDVVKDYLVLDNPKADILYAMQNRLQVMGKLPQEAPMVDLNALTEKLLQKIKSFPV